MDHTLYSYTQWKANHNSARNMRRQSLYELGHEWRRCRYRTRDPKFIVQYFLRRRQRRLFVINQFCVSIDDAFLILLIINFMLNWANPSLDFLYVCLFNTVDSWYNLSMTRLEPQTSGIGSDCSTKWATTTALYYYYYTFFVQCDQMLK